MNNNDIVKEWFLFAENDLKSAVFLKGMVPAPLEIICYHCQQCAEKYLKGFLASKGEEIVKTHDLTSLSKSCVRYEPRFETVADYCLRLTDYAVNIRYPAYFEISQEDMELAITDASMIKEFITKLINL